MPKKALKSDWGGHEPMPQEHVILSFQHEYSPGDYEKIQYGVIPEQMEDKWFLYFEDNKLHCHRSWTGFCLYIVEFEVSEKSSQIIKVTVNRDREQYTEGDNNWDCQFVVYLINLLLLNKHTPYPEKDDIDPETSAVQQWSQMGRAMLGEEYEKMRKGMRRLSENFISELKSGLLKPILDLVKLDSTLCLEIRDNYTNIYYRGGNIIKIEEKKGQFTANFDRKYLDENLTKVPDLPEDLNNNQDIMAWVDTFPFLKHEMDLWFGLHLKNEREFQQLMLRENNFDASAKGTDYFICDIEYANHTGRFDLVAVKWPSSSSDRKNNKSLRLAFIEMKYMDNALRGTAGLCKHVEDINVFLSSDQYLEGIKNEMKIIFNQKLNLGLIDNQNPIESFSNDEPEFILALINHDPASSILRDELNKLPDCPNADIKIALSNFMGYGLYSENIHRLEDFLNHYERCI